MSDPGDRLPETVARRWLRRWPILGLVFATGIKLLLWMSGPAVRSLAGAGLLDTASTVAIAASGGFLIVPLVVALQRRLLWRVRRRLVLSYVFIGLIPVVLLGIFFLLAGLLTLLSASSYLVKLSLDDLVDEARIAVNGVAAELQAATGGARPDLESHRAALARRHPDASMVVVGLAGGQGSRLSAGPWQLHHLRRHGRSGPAATGSRASSSRGRKHRQIVARAVRLVMSGGASVAIVVDLPVGEATVLQILEQTGLELGNVTETLVSAADPESRPNPIAPSGTFAWFSFVEHTNWGSGQTEFLYQKIRVDPWALYARILGALARIGDVSLGYAFLVALAAVAALFLIVELTALFMGLTLARSITGAVHELSIGTDHVRRGDFRHRIEVATRDQLGELAKSFNRMTGSVSDLLQQAAEKKRLEEGLRIAREI